MAKADLWDNARAGTVEVRLVPDLPDLTQNDRGEGRVTAAELHQHETPTALEACRARLNARRPLGTICDVEWAPLQDGSRRGEDRGPAGGGRPECEGPR